MILILISILGLCYGSFINVLVYRIPNNISIIFPGSFCPKCKNSIPFYRNIPILSYFIQLAKCHNCKDKISIQYPLVELLTALLLTLNIFAIPHLSSNYSVNLIVSSSQQSICCGCR